GCFERTEEARPMATLTISLPDDHASFVREQAESQGSSVDAYLDGLVREALAREAKKRLDALLIEGLESGPGRPMTPETWEVIRTEARTRLEARRRDR